MNTYKVVLFDNFLNRLQGSGSIGETSVIASSPEHAIQLVMHHDAVKIRDGVYVNTDYIKALTVELASTLNS